MEIVSWFKSFAFLLKIDLLSSLFETDELVIASLSFRLSSSGLWRLSKCLITG